MIYSVKIAGMIANHVSYNVTVHDFFFMLMQAQADV